MMGRKTLLMGWAITALLLVVSWFGWGEHVLAVAKARAKIPYQGRVYEADILRFIDGDSAVVDINVGLGIWLHDQRLRLSRVDTPERGQLDYETATRVSRSTCPAGLVSLVEITGRDKYGRWLTEMKCRGVSLNDRLIQRGWVYD